MAKVSKLVGREYKPFDYVGAPDADKVIIAMGSGCETIEETINYLNKQGRKARPDQGSPVPPVLRGPASCTRCPRPCKKIAVLDRTKEPGALGEPLYTDVLHRAAWKTALRTSRCVGGRYGLGSKEFTPTMVKAVYDNLAGEMKNHFTVGIEDDVTGTSLKLGEQLVAAPEGTICCKFYGLGSDGTVGANKNSIKIIGDHTDMYAQGYFAYDSKKSGGLTVSHLRFGKKPIQSTYLIDAADFVACHNPSYVTRYDMVSSLKEGGVFLLNSPWTAEEMEAQLPAGMKRHAGQEKGPLLQHRRHRARAESRHGQPHQHHHAGCVLQAGRCHPLRGGRRVHEGLRQEDLRQEGRRDRQEELRRDRQRHQRPGGNQGARGVGERHDRRAPARPWKRRRITTKVIEPILAQEGDKLPVCAFSPDGFVPTGTTKYEKRGIAVNVPEWSIENCIQCDLLAGLPARRHPLHLSGRRAQEERARRL